jgi:hypothetical protein
MRNKMRTIDLKHHSPFFDSIALQGVARLLRFALQEASERLTCDSRIAPWNRSAEAWPLSVGKAFVQGRTCVSGEDQNRIALKDRLVEGLSACFQGRKGPVKELCVFPRQGKDRGHHGSGNPDRMKDRRTPSRALRTASHVRGAAAPNRCWNLLGLRLGIGPDHPPPGL